MNESFNKIDEEQQRLQHLETPNPSTRELSQPSKNKIIPGFYKGAVIFRLAQIKEWFILTIYEMLDDFLEYNELRYYKVLVRKDVRRDVDYKRMSNCTVSALAGE